MSRTNRKSNLTETRSLAKQIQRKLDYWQRRPYYIKNVLKSDEQYEADLKAEEEWYQEAAREYKRRYGVRPEWDPIPGRDRPRHYYVGRYYTIRVYESREEVIEETKKEWASYHRDGGMGYESSRNRGFKWDSKKAVRRKARQMIHHAMKHGDYDKPYPADCDEKHRIWDWW